jgi:hypothetical protein
MGALAMRFGLFTAFVTVGGIYALAALGVLLATPAPTARTRTTRRVA